VPAALLGPATLLLGVIMLLVGGDVLVRGAIALSQRLGVSPMIVGLTVVAFGTSAPELALNISAAVRGNTDLSFGNIVGSNIANIGLILGISALLKPMAVHTALLKREIPVMIVVSILFAAMAMTPRTGLPRIGRAEGIVLLIGFLAFAEMMRRGATRGETPEKPPPKTPVGLAILMLGAGLGLLVAGGTLGEHGAVGVARLLGLSETVIGLTVVAVATSLPELATSLMAARRGHTDIAVGNIVGSNIFNILLVMGTTATIAPTPLPPGGWRPLATMLLLAVLLVPISRTSRGSISRLEGAVLLAIYTASLTLEVLLSR